MHPENIGSNWWARIVMIKKPHFILQFYYFIVMVTVTVGILALLGFYWKSGLIDTHYTSTINEAMVNLDQLNKEDNLLKIDELVNKDRSSDAIKVFENIERKFKKIILIKNIQNSEFDLSAKAVKSQLENLITYPQLNAVIAVLGQKLDALNEYVEQNNWKTLSRIGAKLKSVVYVNKDQSPKKIGSIVDILKRNNSLMLSIIDSSLIDELQKKTVRDRIESINFELSILEKYVQDVQKFYVVYTKMQNDFNNWKIEAGGILEKEKIEIQNRNRQFVSYLFLFLILSFVLNGVGFFIYGKTKKQLQKRGDRSILDTIQNIILNSRPEFPENVDHDFLYELKKNHFYIQKRMSFSSVFQEALPFPATLFDSNLKVIWANPLFCDCFKIQNIELDKDYLSWDYLARFTNLNDHNPVMDALKGNISGIYQVKIRADQSSLMLPYEMYVNPVNINQNKTVMVFFYPLASIEQTINEQSYSLLTPIQKSLDALVTGQFDEHFKKSIQEDFYLINIPQVYEQFSTLNDFYSTQKQGLLSEIDRLEDEIKDHYKLLADIDIKNREYKKIQMELLDGLNGLKRHIISYMEFSSGHISHSDMVLTIYRDIVNSQESIEELNSRLRDRQEDVQNLLGQLGGYRNEMKIYKENVNLVNAKLIQLLDKVLVYELVESFELRKLCGILRKVKSELLVVDQDLDKFFTVFKNFDLKFSKLIHHIDDNKTNLLDVERISHSKENLIYSLQENVIDRNNLGQKQEVYEDKIVKSLETFFSAYRKNLNYFKEIYDLMNNMLDQDKTTLLPEYIDDNKNINEIDNEVVQ